MSINSSSQSELHFNNIEFYTTYETYNSDTASDINFAANSTYKKMNTVDSLENQTIDSPNMYEITCACCGKKVFVASVKQDLCFNCMEELADSLAFAND